MRIYVNNIRAKFYPDLTWNEEAYRGCLKKKKKNFLVPKLAQSFFLVQVYAIRFLSVCKSRPWHIGVVVDFDGSMNELLGI